MYMYPACVHTFSIMQLGSERGVGVAFTKIIATEQQEYYGNWESAYLIILILNVFKY